MGLQRKIERNQLKRKFKDHNKGVEKNIELNSEISGNGIRKEREVKNNGI